MIAFVNEKVSVGTGGQTKFNRAQQGLRKNHWIDAAVVGECPKMVFRTQQPLLIKAMGHGCRQVIHVDAFGFPRRNGKGALMGKSAVVKQVRGFQTGDIVRAVVTKGKKMGEYVGRVAVRTTGSFNIKTLAGTIQGISHKYCSFVHKKKRMDIPLHSVRRQINLPSSRFLPALKRRGFHATGCSS